MTRFLSALFLLAGGMAAWAQESPPRTALVMGVGDYGGAKFKGGTIPNLPGITTADLPGMETKLKSLGFSVTVVTNPTLSEAKAAVDAFSARIKASPGVSLFYFSGHGGEYEGKNYLIPRGANIGSKADLSDEALSAQRVLNGMEESGAQVNLVFLDCCREDLGKGVGGAEMAPLKAKGSFIGFATRSGDFADPGEEGSPYTRFLLKHLDKPGVSVSDMYSLVIGEVKDFSKRVLGEERRPGFYSELDAPFYLVPVKFTPGSAPNTPSMNDAEIEKRARELAAKMARESSPAGLEAGKPFTNSLGMKFVPVPGTQVMMCIHETRNADYAAYAAAQKGVNQEWMSEAVGKYEHPVVNVSHEDAEAFCRWLSAKESKTYRLPTDAEWSVAVGLQSEKGRTAKEKEESGRGDIFPWGSYFPPKAKDGNYDTSVLDDGYEGTAPVMSFNANKLGIYDLGGNVLERCQDLYDESDGYRVSRGSSWMGEERASLCASHRSGTPPGSRSYIVGFRCVSVAEPETREQLLLMPSTPDSVPTPLVGAKEFTNTLGMKFVPVLGTQVMMCIHETRNADYAAYAATQVGVDETWRQKAGPGKEQHPVVNVNYGDAEAFCQWLSAKEGKSYRLPSDAEWSAAVGLPEEQGETPAEKHQNGPAKIYPWSGGHYPPRALDGNYDVSGVDDGYQETAPVMSYRANERGIHDLGGNVWEWCQDWFDASREHRVLRGFSHRDDGRLWVLRSSHRLNEAATVRSGSGGFRCVLQVSSTAASEMPRVIAVPPEMPAAPQVPLGGKGFTNSLGMKFVKVPGTQVLICVHETRNADYAAFAADQGGVDESWRAYAESGKGQHPVVKVSYKDAEAFCRWLSAKEKTNYRLPTDAEWSLAVGLHSEMGLTPEEKGKNGTENIFPWGNHYPPEQGDGNYDKDVLVDGYDGTAPVMSFRANQLGVYDLGGNVWEWCLDWKNDAQDSRVLRGASWSDVSLAQVLLRSSFRRGVDPAGRGDNGGFRCVLVVAGG